MNNFKQHFQLFLERKYFSDNLVLFRNMVSQLKMQLKDSIDIVDDEFYLDFDEDSTVRVKILMSPPKSISKKHFGDDAIYNPSDETIYLFLKNIFDDIPVDKIIPYTRKMPVRLEEVVIHELSHAYEHIKREIADDTKLPSVAHYTGPEDETIRSSSKRYINNLAEINSYLHQWIGRELKTRSLIYYMSAGDVTGAAKYLFNKIRIEPHFNNLFDKNKKWFYKTIYTTLDHLIAK